MHRIRSVTGFTNPDRQKMPFFYMMGMQIKEEANLSIFIQAIIEVEKKLAAAPIKNDSKQ